MTGGPTGRTGGNISAQPLRGMEAQRVERIRQSVDLIRSQVAKLKPIHKVLVGSGVVIIFMAMFLVAQYAGGTNMVPIDVPLEMRDVVEQEFRARNIKFTPAGSDFLVPLDRQWDALSVVTQNSSGQAGGTALLDQIKEQAWYANRHQNRQQYIAALNGVLSNVISRWSFVKSADVFLTPPEERASAIGTPRSRATASVSIVPASGQLTPEQVSGISKFLAGTIPNLSPEDVTVLNADTGQPMRAQSSAEMGSSAYMELQKRVDAYWLEKIEHNLSHIPGVIVQVNARVDVTHEATTELTYKKEGEGTINPITRESEESTESSEPTVGGAPGVQPNTGAGIQNASAESAGIKTSKTESEFEAMAGRTETMRTDPKGYATRINATVKMPRSYYERIWRVKNADATDGPDDAALQTIETDEIDKVRNEVLALIDTVASAGDGGATAPLPGTVVVNTYTDLVPPAGMGPAAAGSLQLPGKFATLPWKSAGLAILSVVSLFLMVRLARNGSSGESLPSAAELVGIPPSLSSSVEDLVGQADESAPAIDAVEIDSDELRTRSIVEQIDDMVKTDSTEARRLVSRWIASQS